MDFLWTIGLQSAEVLGIMDELHTEMSAVLSGSARDCITLRVRPNEGLCLHVNNERRNYSSDHRDSIASVC